jgi:hypothetical protein
MHYGLLKEGGMHYGLLKEEGTKGLGEERGDHGEG